MLIHLLSYPVLIVEIVDAVKESRLLLLACLLACLLRVRAIQVKRFSLLISDWVCT